MNTDILESNELEEILVEETDGTTTENTRNKCRISPTLLPMKFCYLFTFMAKGSWYPYNNIFLTSVGLSASQAGLVSAQCTIMALFSVTIWMLVSDYTKRQRTLIVFLSFATIGTIFPLPWISAYINDAANIQNERYVNSSSNITIPNFNSTEDINLSVYRKIDSNQHPMFYSMMIIFTMLGIFEMSFPTFIDTNVVKFIKSLPPKTTTFGKQRVFGAIGYAFGSFITGVIIDSFIHSTSTLTPYSICVFVYVPSFIISIPLMLLISKQGESDEEQHEEAKQETKKNKKLLSAVIKTIMTFPNIMFLVTIFLSGIINAVFIFFLYLFMNEMKSTKTAMALSTVMGNIADIAMFPIANFFVKKFGDLECLIFSLFTNGVRAILIAFTTNPWAVLPIELLHSTGFALYFSSMYAITYKISPKEIQSTMFGVINTTYFSLPTIIVNVGGGIIYQKYGGGKTLFVVSAIMTGVWTIIASIYFFGKKWIYKENVFKLKLSIANDQDHNIN